MLSCYSFKGSVSTRKTVSLRREHGQSWASGCFVSRTWKVAVHISSFVAGHKENLEEVVQLDSSLLIAILLDLSR